MSKDKVDYKDQIKPGKLDKIPSWIKVILLKYWVAGATFYFFGMGGAFIWATGNNEDSKTIKLWAILGLGLALTLEYIAKPIIRLMRTNIDDTYRYNLINLRGIKSLLLHFIYGFVVVLLVMATSVFLDRLGINLDILNIADGGTEPFLFALIFIIFDIIFIFLKRLSINIYKKIRIRQENKRIQSLLDENDVPVMGEEETIIQENDHFLNDNE